MTIQEIFNTLATHMIEGVMYHDEMAHAYDFLGLYGFAMCHNYHHIEETTSYIKLSTWYSKHEHKLLNLNQIPQPNLIPSNWYKYTTMAVDINTKREAVKTLMTKWVEWERTTKKLYQDMKQELCAINEVAAAQFVDCLITDVDEELIHAEKKFIQLETLGYDIITIIEWQEPLKNKYKKKIRW